MFRSLVIAATALAIGLVGASRANAGLFPIRALEQDIWIPMLYASYDGAESELVVTGKVATLNGQMGDFTMADFRLDAKISTTGEFTPKGSFYIRNATTEFLKGTITEAKTANFAKQGDLEFIANENIEGSLANLYGGLVGIRLDLSPSEQLLQEQGFSYDMGRGFQMLMGTSAEVGRPVPEPASIFALASVVLLGLVFHGRRRRRHLAIAS